ncbi:MAG: hypothetical protein IJ043_01355 [Clostridia bacterium]|nr:hypothetical protein [Clostridia bacterium]
MKRWMILFLAILLLLSGCSKESEVPDLSAENFDNSGEKTVVYRGDQDFTLSFTVDGTQQIENGTYWFYELSDQYERDWSDPFFTYDRKKQELNGSKAYDKLKNCFATNGNWPLFLNPVHTEYTESNQNRVDGKLLDLANKQFADDVTCIVSDIWSCDMDGDGGEETIFKASDSQSGTIIIAYANGENCQGLYAGNVEKLTPMVCDLNGDGTWSLLLYKKGDYESFTSFDYTGGNFTKCYEIIF